MSIWNDHGLGPLLLTILGEVRAENTHGERPYVSGYQLATALHRVAPGAFAAIDSELGGVGVGQRHSVAQYLAREVSRRAGDLGVERAFLSHQDVRFMEFAAFGEKPVVSSNVDANYDLALFRLP